MMLRIENMREEDRTYFQQFYPKHRVMDQLLQEWSNASTMDIDHIIVKGTWTPSGCARDCGDHYIIARHDRYDRIDKETMEVTQDVEDR